MKALQVQKFADLTTIQVQELADCQPTADQVVVQVRAAGLKLPTDKSGGFLRSPKMNP
jgi:NADPH:quinone reductase-like Zn-dependent oxidoreductase